MDHQIQQFRALIEPWIPAYRQVSIAAAGVIHEGKQWLLAAKVEFAAGGLRPLSIHPLGGPIFWTANSLTDFSQEAMDSLLADAAAGKLKIGSTEASCNFDSTHRPHASFYAGHSPLMKRDESRARSPSIIISGGSIFNLFNKFPSSADVDWHLRALNPPFMDLAGLYASHGLIKPGHDQTLIEIRAPAPLFIEQTESHIESGQAHIVVMAANGMDVGELKVGFKGVGVQQASIVDRSKTFNLRYAVHAAFDPDLDVLRRMLFDSKRDAKAFEDGVAMVFGLLGFSVVQHGRSKKLSDATDIVAMTPSGITAAIECTLGTPTHGNQASTALQRSEAIRKSFIAKGMKSEVVPIVVTAMASDDVMQERSEAEGRGVAVICANDLDRILQSIQAMPNPDEWLSTLQNRTSHLRLMRALGQG